MLRAAVIFFIIALISSAFSYGDVAASAADIAIILFFSFPIVVIGSQSLRLLRREKLILIAVRD